MPLTRDFKETVVELAKDKEFRAEMLREVIETYLIEGDVKTGNILLRDYLNATDSFATIAQDLGLKVPSLRRMLSSSGNARSQNMFAILRACLRQEGLTSMDSLAHSQAA